MKAARWRVAQGRSFQEPRKLAYAATVVMSRTREWLVANSSDETGPPKPWGIIATGLLALQPTLFVLAGLYGMLVARTWTLVPRPDELSSVIVAPGVTVFWTVV